VGQEGFYRKIAGVGARLCEQRGQAGHWCGRQGKTADPSFRPRVRGRPLTVFFRRTLAVIRAQVAVMRAGAEVDPFAGGRRGEERPSWYLLLWACRWDDSHLAADPAIRESVVPGAEFFAQCTLACGGPMPARPLQPRRRPAIVAFASITHRPHGCRPKTRG